MFVDTYFSCLTTCTERIAIISLNIGNFGKSDEKRLQTCFRPVSGHLAFPFLLNSTHELSDR